MGAPTEDGTGTNLGAVYVLESNSGSWSEAQKLTASDAEDGDVFGFSVDIDGDFMVVGSRLEDGAGTDRGAAYVFEKQSGVWTQVQKITASDAEDNDQFGYSVAIDGDFIMVGAPTEDGTETSMGATYVFENQSGVWVQVQKLSLGVEASSYDQFGFAVSIDSDFAVISARLKDSTIEGDFTSSNKGAAYIFENQSGVWTQVDTLVPSDINDEDQFGYSVSISNDFVVVGSWLANAPGTDSGAAYVFENQSGVWTEVQKLTASDGESADRFGVSVSMFLDYIVVGAHREDGDGVDQGKSYLFENIAGTWTEVNQLKASDAEDNDRFGFATALNKNVAIVGAYLEDGLGINRGAAYIYDLRIDNSSSSSNSSSKSSKSSVSSSKSSKSSVSSSVSSSSSSLSSSSSSSSVSSSHSSRSSFSSLSSRSSSSSSSVSSSFSSISSSSSSISSSSVSSSKSSVSSSSSSKSSSSSSS